MSDFEPIYVSLSSRQTLALLVYCKQTLSALHGSGDHAGSWMCLSKVFQHQQEVQHSCTCVVWMSSLAEALSADKRLFILSHYLQKVQDWLCWWSTGVCLSELTSFQGHLCKQIHVWGRICPITISLIPFHEGSWDKKTLCPAEIRLFEGWIHVWSPFCIPTNLSRTRLSKAPMFMLLADASSFSNVPWVVHSPGEKKGQHLLQMWLALIHSVTTAFFFILLASAITSPVGWCLFHSWHANSCLSLRGLTKIYWKCLKL